MNSPWVYIKIKTGRTQEGDSNCTITQFAVPFNSMYYFFFGDWLCQMEFALNRKFASKIFLKLFSKKFSVFLHAYVCVSRIGCYKKKKKIMFLNESFRPAWWFLLTAHSPYELLIRHNFFLLFFFCLFVV